MNLIYDKLFKQQLQNNLAPKLNHMEESDQSITTSVLNQYSKELECPLSFQLFDYPVSTYCGHTFSWLPLCIHLRNDSRCPLCRQHVERNQLKPNFVVRNLVQIHKRLQSQKRERELTRQQKKKLQKQAAERKQREYQLAEKAKRMQSQLIEKRKQEQKEQQLRQSAAEKNKRQQKYKRLKLLFLKIIKFAAIVALTTIIGYSFLKNIFEPTTIIRVKQEHPIYHVTKKVMIVDSPFFIMSNNKVILKENEKLNIRPESQSYKQESEQKDLHFQPLYFDDSLNQYRVQQ